MSAEAQAPRLRPLGVGEILDVGIKIYRANALTLFKIVVFVVLPAQILVNIVEVSSLPAGVSASSAFIPGRPTFTNNGFAPVSGHDVTILFVGYGIALVINALAGRLAEAGCLRAVADAYLGDTVSWRSSLGFALRRLPAVVAVSIVSAFLIGIGFFLFLIPGIYLWGAFYVAVPALLVEGSGPFRALGRSRRLVRGRWWGTIGVAVIGLLLVSLITGLISGLVIALAFSNPARNTVSGFVLSTLASTVGSMIATPAAAAFTTVLYIDLRVRKEGFDLWLLAQRLGVEPPAGTEPPAFLPPVPDAGSKPPYWPPPPGWEPGTELGVDAPPELPPARDEPPYWPPPPGWKPEGT